jgi:hypothetical protein
MNTPFDESKRIIFHEELNVMEVDFSDITFTNSGDVNSIYDAVEKLVGNTAQKWYFMVNYGNTQIFPEAWFQFSLRGKNINMQSSLGSVRFDPREPTRLEILERAKDENFNPNLVSTREEALDRIEEMKVNS